MFIYTAAVKEYADAILDRIDPKGYIKKRFYRDVRSVRVRSMQDCLVNESGGLVKKIGLVTERVERLIVIDDNPSVEKRFERKRRAGEDV